MSKEKNVDQAIEGLEKAKADLKSVSSWIYAHEETWSGETADDIKDQIADINDMIQDLKESVKEGAQEPEEEETEGEED